MFEGVVSAFVQHVTIYDTIGVLGVILFLFAYAALQFGLIIGRGFLYPALNAFASCLVMIGLLDSFNLASTISQILWFAISIASLTRLTLATRSATFSKEESDLLAAKQIQLPAFLARKLLDMGEWRNAPAGTVLTEQGKPVSHLYYLSKGAAEATRNDAPLARLGPSSFVGEFVCLTGEPAVGTVTLTEDSRLFCIESEKLRQFATRDGDISEALESSIVQEIGRKVVSAIDPRRGVLKP